MPGSGRIMAGDKSTEAFFNPVQTPAFAARRATPARIAAKRHRGQVPHGALPRLPADESGRSGGRLRLRDDRREEFDAAQEALDATEATERTPIVDYARGYLHFRTQRWTDVLTALAGASNWTDDHLVAGADVMVGTACAQLGLFGEAVKRLEAAETGPIPAARTAAMFTRGLCLLGNRQEERSPIGVRDRVRSVTRIRRQRQGLGRSAVPDRRRLQQVIDSRTDQWDPASVPADDAPGVDAGDGSLLAAARSVNSTVRSGLRR